jgi:coproporphyrinogen III oxidase
MLVQTTDAGENILCGKTDVNRYTGFGTKFDDPLIDQNRVFEIAVTKMVGKGYQPIYIKLSENDGRNAVTFKYDQRGEFGNPGPYVELKSDWSSASHGKADDVGWQVRGTNIVTFVVKPRSVSVYINGKFFSAAERDANKAFYQYDLMYTPIGMGATYVRSWN